ncbi:hypothetical protein CMI47_02350 [Candidatus Pacearchaeota archaeon]|nr:hypothetical protein [Candidatus Pacearchaeota archaeon]
MHKFSNFIFNNYEEYFSITRPLSLFQRKRLFDTLSPSEKEFLENDFDKNRWEELLVINEINRKSDLIKKKYNRDLFFIRLKVLSGKKVRVKKVFWNYVISMFADFPSEYLKSVLGGIISRADRDDPSFLILKLDKEQYNE